MPGGTGAGATKISKNYDDCFETTAKLNVAIMEESATMAGSQQARGLIDYVMGTAAKPNEARMEERAAMEHS